jgi:DNA-binding NtrC family response regulator
MGRILIADDHETLRRTLAQSLAENGHEVDEAPNGNAAIEKLHEGAYDVVVSDLRMGGSTGIDVLKTAKALHPACSVVLMTAFGSVNTAVEAMKAGAFDYVQKPFEIEEMEVKVQKALELRRMQHEIDYLRHAQGGIYEFDNIIGSSGALSAVLGVVKKVATAPPCRGAPSQHQQTIAGAVHHLTAQQPQLHQGELPLPLQENLLESEFSATRRVFTGADKQRIGRGRPTAARCSSTKSAT